MLDYQLLILGVIQGIAEFLPISSSAHLWLAAQFMGKEHSLGWDVALHAGTLIAVIVHFRHNIYSMVYGVWHFHDSSYHKERQLLKNIIIAQIPVTVMGAIFVSLGLRTKNMTIIAIILMVSGIIMWLFDKYMATKKKMHIIKTKDAIIISIFHGLAVIPGVSRSGACITGGRAIGMNRADSVRYSFLASIPVVLIAFIVVSIKLSTLATLLNPAMLAGILTSAVVGIITINISIKLVSKFGMGPIAIYRIIIGALLIFISNR